MGNSSKKKVIYSLITRLFLSKNVQQVGKCILFEGPGVPISVFILFGVKISIYLLSSINKVITRRLNRAFFYIRGTQKSTIKMPSKHFYSLVNIPSALNIRLIRGKRQGRGAFVCNVTCRYEDVEKQQKGHRKQFVHSATNWLFVQHSCHCQISLFRARGLFT